MPFFPLRTRLAPTPSGYLHTGNALSFLLTAELAQRAGGRLRLRIDDLDGARVRPQYLENIFQTLHWLGIDWQDGPRDPTDFQQHFSQHLPARLARYEALLQALTAVPGAVYACTCSRAELAVTTPDGRYAGTCRARALPLNTPGAAWRLRVPVEAQVAWSDGRLGPQAVAVAEAVGDFVVRKKDGLPAYQVASVADDVADGTTLIVRGADLLPSTAAQLWLAQVAGAAYAAFGQTNFLHHPLVLDDTGRKMSKSQQTTLDRGALHDANLNPAALRRQAAKWLSLAH